VSGVDGRDGPDVEVDQVVGPGPPRWARARRAWTAIELRLFAVCTYVLEPLWAVGPAALPLLLIPGTFALICVFLAGWAALRLVSSGVRRLARRR